MNARDRYNFNLKLSSWNFRLVAVNFILNQILIYSKQMDSTGLDTLMDFYGDCSSQEFAYDYVYSRNRTFFQPLGKISKSQIKQAERVLLQIQSELEKSAPNQRAILDLSNQFHMLVPSPERSRISANLQTINNLETLQDQMVLLRALRT